MALAVPLEILKLETVAALNTPFVLKMIGNMLPWDRDGHGAYMYDASMTEAQARDLYARSSRVRKELAKVAIKPFHDYLVRRVRSARTKADVLAVLHAVGLPPPAHLREVRGAATRITSAAYDALSSPHTRFGRRRLLAEFEQMRRDFH